MSATLLAFYLRLSVTRLLWDARWSWIVQRCRVRVVPALGNFFMAGVSLLQGSHCFRGKFFMAGVSLLQGSHCFRGNVAGAYNLLFQCTCRIRYH